MRSAATDAKAAAPVLSLRSRAMLAIGVIVIFLGVILTLNLVEFGRID
ncbi:hypothetical protein [Caulobacter sp.]